MAPLADGNLPAAQPWMIGEVTVGNLAQSNGLTVTTSGRQTGTEHCLCDRQRPIEDRGYSMLVINRGSDQGYDSWDENTQQAGRGEACRGKRKKRAADISSR